MPKTLSGLIVLMLCMLLAGGCGPVPTPAQEAKAPVIGVIGKSVHPYWSNVEAGVQAAGKELDVQTIFFVPPKEDVAAQVQTLETYIAQRVAGIAIAPSDPLALEPFMKKAVQAGIPLITLDTPPVDGSVSLAYIGTDNTNAGRIAGETMVTLLPEGGKVGVGRGSDTARNALQRTEGFLAAIEGSGIVSLPAYNDREDPAIALELAGSTISANPDLAGAFAIYAATGPAWVTAIQDAGAVGQIKLITFDATTDIIHGIQKGVVAATIAQREYSMGYQSVQLLKLITEKGVEAALVEMGAVDGVIDTGVDVVTAANLKEYQAALDAKRIPHEWHVP